MGRKEPRCRVSGVCVRRFIGAGRKGHELKPDAGLRRRRERQGVNFARG